MNKKMIIAIVSVVLVVVAVGVAFVAALSSPTTQLSRLPSPKNNPSIATKRDDAKATVAAQFTAFENELSVRHLDSTEEGDICGAGQYNAWTQQDFRYECGYGKTQFYNFGKDVTGLKKHKVFYAYLPPSVADYFTRNKWREDPNGSTDALYKDNLQAEVGSDMGGKGEKMSVYTLNPPLWGGAEFRVTVAGLYYRYVNGKDYGYESGNGEPERNFEEQLKPVVNEGNVVVAVSFAKQYYYEKR